MDLDLPKLVQHHLKRKLDDAKCIDHINFSGLSITSKLKFRDGARNEETIPKVYSESSFINGNNETKTIEFKDVVTLTHTCNVTLHNVRDIPLQHTVELPKSKTSRTTFEFDISKLQQTERNDTVGIDLNEATTEKVGIQVPVPRFTKTTVHLRGNIHHEAFDFDIELNISGDIEVDIKRQDGLREKTIAINIKDLANKDKGIKKAKNGVFVKLSGACSFSHDFLHVPTWQFEASTDELSEYIEELIGESGKELKTHGRALLEEMTLIKIHASSKTCKGVPRKFLLFNDILVHIAEERSRKSALKDVVPLINAKLKNLPDSKSLTNAWQIQCPKKTIILSGSSKEEKLKYMKLIKNTITNLRVKRLQDEVDQTEQIMRDQVERLMRRRVSVEELNHRASTLSESSQQFSMVAAHLHYQNLPCWKRFCCCCCIPKRLRKAGKSNKDMDDMDYFEEYKNKIKGQPDDVRIVTAV